LPCRCSYDCCYPTEFSDCEVPFDSCGVSDSQCDRVSITSSLSLQRPILTGLTMAPGRNHYYFLPTPSLSSVETSTTQSHRRSDRRDPSGSLRHDADSGLQGHHLPYSLNADPELSRQSRPGVVPFPGRTGS